MTVRSVNHRFLDLSVHLSRRLAELEPDVRRLVQARVQRGKVEVSVQARLAQDDAAAVSAPAAADRRPRARAARGPGGARPGRRGDASSDVARFPGAFEVAGDDGGAWARRRSALLIAIEQALEGLDAMRAAEGRRPGAA